jgi:uroporphyrinogen-III synthase
MLLLLSSAEALQHLRHALDPPIWQRLCRATAVVSSARIGNAAAMFARVVVATSALDADLLAAAVRTTHADRGIG